MSFSRRKVNYRLNEEYDFNPSTNPHKIMNEQLYAEDLQNRNKRKRKNNQPTESISHRNVQPQPHDDLQDFNYFINNAKPKPKIYNYNQSNKLQLKNFDIEEKSDCNYNNCKNIANFHIDKCGTFCIDHLNKWLYDFITYKYKINNVDIKDLMINFNVQFDFKKSRDDNFTEGVFKNESETRGDSVGVFKNLENEYDSEYVSVNYNNNKNWSVITTLSDSSSNIIKDNLNTEQIIPILKKLFKSSKLIRLFKMITLKKHININDMNSKNWNYENNNILIKNYI